MLIFYLKIAIFYCDTLLDGNGSLHNLDTDRSLHSLKIQFRVWFRSLHSLMVLVHNTQSDGFSKIAMIIYSTPPCLQYLTQLQLSLLD